ncbi:hypothetical protein B0T17DRAFT_508076 [Bombardia bombarda]|uniref:Hemerythrin-like domain-containing protein n=1 Tax=Bombardia bombarda TaxID=252184 RepID=A0AA39X0J4_9PEZI|nr:hypothetical protein B0T17DRAFT_508076 [Bombardia bombarda]
MAPIYADHPFPLTESPLAKLKREDPNAKPDIFTLAASEMAIAHNLMTRILNTIYLQAPHISSTPPSDAISFSRYILSWCTILRLHHNAEEASLFPYIEATAGVAGLMDANVAQHEAFHEGLDKFTAYAQGVADRKERYDGGKVVEMIDGFGPALASHLADEIPSLEGLRGYGDEERFAALGGQLADMGQHGQREISLVGLVVFFSNIDTHYEDDLWINWPPAPEVVKFACRHVFWWLYADIAKFGSVDRHGNLKPLLYAAA